MSDTEYGRIHTDGSRSGGQPIPSEDCPKCERFGDDCGEHSPSWQELAAYWKAQAERLRQPTQSDALLDAEGVKLYWYRQGKDDGVEHERAKIVAWLRDGFVRDWGQLWRNQLINAIEAGEHLKEQSK